MTRRTVIITGANTGLGFECARTILNRDPSWHVVLAVRDPLRGAHAVDRLGAADRCTVLPCDLASLRSVGGFVDALTEADLPPLHAIVCNAGLQVVDTSQVTADGIEMTFGVNHLGHFALVTTLLDHLATPGRIVVVSSGTHDPDKFTGMPAPQYTSAADLARPGNPDDKDGRRRYTTSKLCNMLFAYELDRRLGQGARGVTVTAFDPGLMPGSGLAREYTPLGRLAWRYLFPLLRVLPNVNSISTSGARLAALTVDPSFDGVTGTYFEGSRAIPSSEESCDTAKALDLWATSEQLVATARA